MAEFSKEYLELIGSNEVPDFCYLSAFKWLLEGCSDQLICEGFGSVGVMNENGVCCLLFWDRSAPVSIDDLIKEFKKKMNHITT